ncbi:hypothetical protein [Bacteroides faecalis]|uniref:hypothetical protein n=1 Tax=Bacteroides faecalis TaxID=2447885 RepID=UPI00190F8FA0|nr:hypothetical protein [Bacteroides faecalis]
MDDGLLEQRNRYAMIGALMIIISLIFLFYIGSSMVSATKKYLEQVQGIEITCQ